MMRAKPAGRGHPVPGQPAKDVGDVPGPLAGAEGWEVVSGVSPGSLKVLDALQRRLQVGRNQEETMPHGRPEDFPNGGARWPALGQDGFRTVRWCDMEVGLTTVHAPLDCSQMYKAGGLPGGVCPCPHYGYVFEGRMRAIYPGSDWPDEVIGAGEAYFIPSGHVLVYEEPSRVLELNPAAALQMCMDAMQKAAERGVFGGAPAAAE